MPARISCGLCASAGRHRSCAHRPTAGEIGQGLHASTVIYMHRLGDIDYCQRTSARRRRPNGRQHRLRPTSINRDVCASAGRHRCCLRASASRPRQVTSSKACAHLTLHGCIRQATSANSRQHRPRLAHICRGVCASAGQHWRRPTAGSISRILHASNVASVLLASEVGQRPASSSRRH